ncbi:MAG: DNA translocase FtsK [Chloroflexi bacterium]|nr:DNA translocase FtsK [Chloroflexota bacterium]
MAKSSKASEPKPARLDQLRSLFSDYLAEIAGVVLLALALLTILALSGLSTGAWLSPWVGLWRRWLGWGSVLVVGGLAYAGWRLLMHKRQAAQSAWGRVIALELAAFASLGLISLLWGHSLERAETGLDGGLVGWGLAEAFRLLFGSILPEWMASTLSGAVLLGLLLVSGLMAAAQMGRARDWLDEQSDKRAARVSEVLSVSPFEGEGDEADEDEGQGRRKGARPPQALADFGAGEANQAAAKAPPRSADLPPVDLLSAEESYRPNERHINQSAGLLERTLAEFGIPAKVVGYKVGPTVTQFAVEPGYIPKPGNGDDERGQKVRVSQISALQRDLALALSAQRLRIQAPVPGRSYVGVEVPNTRASLVRLRPILESDIFHRLKSKLGIALGRDVSGVPVAADLAKMPHLLIAGTTGSGKSVVISAITVCLAMNNSPEDLRLIMLDPKMVELVRFNGLPHLMGKVETELERITAVLRWLVAEMGRRYKELESVRARDLESYNRKVERRQDKAKMPRLVVLIDELADLMMNAADHTESTLVRLAQMARATGIHLVVATQRPSTDVVTGLIKANFPARISFAVASAVDSRVILDSTGAEALLGKGDMLYLSPEAAAPLRSQGVLITDREVENVVRYWRTNWETDDEARAPWDEMIRNDAVLSDRDELVESAIEEIRRSGKSSASHLQRALRIGYPRAARLVDELEDMGVLGPVQGGGREREVLVSMDMDGAEDENEGLA